MPANICGKNEEGNKAWFKLCAEPSFLGQQEGFKATKNIFAEEKENILPACWTSPLDTEVPWHWPCSWVWDALTQPQFLPRGHSPSLCASSVVSTHPELHQHRLCRPEHPLATPVSHAQMEREGFFSDSCSSGAQSRLPQKGHNRIMPWAQHSWTLLGRAWVFWGSFCIGNHSPHAAICSCLCCILPNTAGVWRDALGITDQQKNSTGSGL